MTTSPQTHYADSIRAEMHQLVAELLDALGPTAIQAMTATHDRSMPSRWARTDGPEPRAKTQQRLRLGYRVWTMLRDAEGPRTATAWMTGPNPRLKEDTPLSAIRELRSADVVGAAEAFINGTHAA